MLRQLLFPEVRNDLTLKQQLQSNAPQLFPILRAIATVLIVCLGTLFFGQIGSLAFPENGVGAVVGCTVGVLLCLVLGCCATGSWRDVSSQEDGLTRGLVLPHALASQMGGHGHFNLIVTVHRAVGVEIQGQLPLASLPIYAEVECGNNPVKPTCVRSDGRFEEQFKLRVEPTDSSMLVRLKSQGMFGIVNVGYVHVDIQRDVVDASPRRERHFEIQAGDGDSLRWTKPRAALLLSFDVVGDHDPLATMPNPFATDVEGNNKSYGAVDFVSRLTFNPDARLDAGYDDYTHARYG